MSEYLETNRISTTALPFSCSAAGAGVAPPTRLCKMSMTHDETCE